MVESPPLAWKGLNCEVDFISTVVNGMEGPACTASSSGDRGGSVARAC